MGYGYNGFHKKNKKMMKAKCQEKLTETRIFDNDSTKCSESHQTGTESEPEVDHSRDCMESHQCQNLQISTADPDSLMQMFRNAVAPLLNDLSSNITKNFTDMREEINRYKSRIEELEKSLTEMQTRQKELEKKIITPNKVEPVENNEKIVNVKNDLQQNRPGAKEMLHQHAEPCVNTIDYKKK